MRRSLVVLALILAGCARDPVGVPDEYVAAADWSLAATGTDCQNSPRRYTVSWTPGPMLADRAHLLRVVATVNDSSETLLDRTVPVTGTQAVGLAVAAVADSASGVVMVSLRWEVRSNDSTETLLASGTFDGADTFAGRYCASHVSVRAHSAVR